ncbi:MAG TPA: transporter [Gemmatimonadales bacterium]|nr:transporter [Gemmatimonadales bacterium]
MLRIVITVTFCAVPCLVSGQSPRVANPERPTYATHAYAVAPGYAELEQGISATGTAGLSQGTIWGIALKLGISPSLQAEFFGPAYARTSAGGGVGDLGLALKFRHDLSGKSAVALIPGVTAPTGSTAKGLGAGRALGSLTAVYSVDLPATVHLDLNAGPTGVGAGATQWFFSVSGSWGGRVLGVTGECFDFTPGGAGPRFAGVLGAVTVRLAPWAVVDAGGQLGTTMNSPNALFLGLTTNLGRVF